MQALIEYVKNTFPDKQLKLRARMTVNSICSVRLDGSTLESLIMTVSPPPGDPHETLPHRMDAAGTLQPVRAPKGHFRCCICVLCEACAELACARKPREKKKKGSAGTRPAIGGVASVSCPVDGPPAREPASVNVQNVAHEDGQSTVSAPATPGAHDLPDEAVLLLPLVTLAKESPNQQDLLVCFMAEHMVGVPGYCIERGRIHLDLREALLHIERVAEERASQSVTNFIVDFQKKGRSGSLHRITDGKPRVLVPFDVVLDMILRKDNVAAKAIHQRMIQNVTCELSVSWNRGLGNTKAYYIGVRRRVPPALVASSSSSPAPKRQIPPVPIFFPDVVSLPDVDAPLASSTTTGGVGEIGAHGGVGENGREEAPPDYEPTSAFVQRAEQKAPQSAAPLAGAHGGVGENGREEAPPNYEPANACVQRAEQKAPRSAASGSTSSTTKSSGKRPRTGPAVNLARKKGRCRTGGAAAQDRQKEAPPVDDKPATIATRRELLDPVLNMDLMSINEEYFRGCRVTQDGMISIYDAISRFCGCDRIIAGTKYREGVPLKGEKKLIKFPGAGQKRTPVANLRNLLLLLSQLETTTPSSSDPATIAIQRETTAPSASEPGDSEAENSTSPSAQNGQKEGPPIDEPASGCVEHLAVEEVAAPGVDEVSRGSDSGDKQVPSTRHAKSRHATA